MVKFPFLKKKKIHKQKKKKKNLNLARISEVKIGSHFN